MDKDENKRVKIKIETDGKIIEKDGKLLIALLLDEKDEDTNLCQAMMIGHDINSRLIGHALADMPDGFLNELPKSATEAYIERLTEQASETMRNIRKKEEPEGIREGLDDIVSDFGSWLKKYAEGGDQ